jgi:OmpA-OmpF porin, OOP family
MLALPARSLAQATTGQTGATNAPAATAVVVPAANGGSLASTSTSTSTTVVTASAAPAPAPATTDYDWDLLNRRYNSWSGATGGLFLMDPRAAQPGAVRVQLGLDSFRGSDVLRNGDHIEVDNQTLSLSATATKNFEFYASLANRSSNQSRPALAVPTLDALGDVSLGARVGTQLSRVLDLGGDLRGTFVNKLGGGGYDWGATSLSLRAALSIDLQRLPDPFPLVARFNVGYVFDNTGHVVKATEDARYAALEDNGSPAAKGDETTHLVNRFQRLSMGISRLDRLTLGAGVEVPLKLAEHFYMHPLVEWQLALPVNRQGYDCPFVTQAANVGTRKSAEDSCYERTPSSVPMNLSLGLRVVPPARGLSALIGVDLGLSGSNRFVRELSPNLPWRILFAVSYDYDARPETKGESTTVATAVAVAPVTALAQPAWRIQGIVTAIDGTPLADARVHFANLPLSTLITEADGRFASEPLPPSTVEIEVKHPDYEPGRCAAVITETGGDIALRCTLTPKPVFGKIQGKLLDSAGSPVVNARIILTGPSNGLMVSDVHGEFLSQDLNPGSYTLRIEAGGFFIRQQTVQIEPRATVTQNPVLSRKPIGPTIVFSGDTVDTPTLSFLSETSSELNAAGVEAVLELADLLLVRGDLYLQVQGFGATDSVASARAEAIKQRLVDAGVPVSHVEATGGGKKKLRLLLHR